MRVLRAPQQIGVLATPFAVLRPRPPDGVLRVGPGPPVLAVLVPHRLARESPPHRATDDTHHDQRTFVVEPHQLAGAPPHEIAHRLVVAVADPTVPGGRRVGALAQLLDGRLLPIRAVLERVELDVRIPEPRGESYRERRLARAARPDDGDPRSELHRATCTLSRVSTGSSPPEPGATLAALAGDSQLADRIRLVVEPDRPKQVLRRTVVTDGTRRENTAEHSWHVAMMALVLADAADEPVDPMRVARLLLVHDIVEIDAGDTFVYDADGEKTKAARERAAAERLFGLLPDGQGDELRACWFEFEDGTTAEARFGRALDRLQPLLLNHASAGQAWREHGITADQVRAVNAAIEDGSAALWELAQHLIDDAVTRGWLPETGR